MPVRYRGTLSTMIVMALSMISMAGIFTMGIMIHAALSIMALMWPGSLALAAITQPASSAWLGALLLIAALPSCHSGWGTLHPMEAFSMTPSSMRRIWGRESLH